MAGDGRVGLGNSIVHDKQVKVFRIGDHIVGCAGGGDDAATYVAWCKMGRDPDMLPDGMDLNAVHLTPKGVFICCRPGYHLQKVTPPIAIGSGSEYAEGAMLAGATPTEAVRIAAKKEMGTGGKVTTLSLE